MRIYIPMMRAGVTDLARTVEKEYNLILKYKLRVMKGRTVDIGVLAWKETRTFADDTPCFSAILVTTSLARRGELSEPRGE